MGKVYLDLSRESVRGLSDLVQANGRSLDEVADLVIEAGLRNLPEELRGKESTALGVLVKQVREKHGLSRVELGGMWNTSGSMVKRVEDGCRINPRTMWVVATWLQISATQAYDLASQPARTSERVDERVVTHPLLQKWMAMDYVTRRVNQAGSDWRRPRYVVVWLSSEEYGGFAGFHRKREAEAKVREFVLKRKPVVVCTRYWRLDDPLVYLPDVEMDAEVDVETNGAGDIPGLSGPGVAFEETGPSRPGVVVARVPEVPAVSLEEIDPDSLDWDAPIDFDAVFGRVGHFETGEEWLASNLAASQLQPGHYYAVDLRDGRLVGKAAAVEELPVEADGERRFVFFAEAAPVVEAAASSDVPSALEES